MGARKRMPVEFDTCKGAASSSHLEVLKWARTNGCVWQYRIFDLAAAASNGHLHILQWAMPMAFAMYKELAVARHMVVIKKCLNGHTPTTIHLMRRFVRMLPVGICRC